MSDCIVKILKTPSKAEINHAADILVCAFKEDVLGRTIVGGKMELLKPLFTAITRAASLEGVLYGVYDEAGEMVSVGVWYPPGVHFMASEAQRNLGWDDVMKAVPPDCLEWWKEADEEGSKEWKELIGRKYDDDSWHAFFIGTDPAHRGKGYGGAMMRDVLNKAEKDHKVVTLLTQSQENMKWYSKLGFKLLKSSEHTGKYGTLGTLFMIWGDTDSEARK